MIFRFSDEYEIDTDKEPWKRTGLRVGIYAEPGHGKSYTAASVFVEPFLEQGGTAVIFEPRSEWYTLKEKYPVQMVGGPNLQDIPFTASHPALYADAVAESGISLIFYTPDAPSIDRLVEFTSSFLDHLIKRLEKKKRPVMVLVEEANRYCPLSTKNNPEGVAPWVFGRMIGRILELMRDSRKIGVVPVLATQRPQDLNFAVRMLCNLTLFGSFSIQDTAYIDREVLVPMRRNLSINIDVSELSRLKPGEWVVVERGKDSLQQVTAKRRTPHGAETPILEAVAEAPAEVRQAAGELAEKLRALVEKEKREEEAGKLKQRLRELENQLEEMKKKAEIKLAVKEMLSAEGKDELSQRLEEFAEENKRLKEEKKHLLERISALEEEQRRISGYAEAVNTLKALVAQEIDYDRVASEVIKRLGNQKAELSATLTEPLFSVKVERPELAVDDKDIRGLLASLIAEGFFDAKKSLSQIKNKLRDIGHEVDEKTLEAELIQLCRWRFLERRYTDRYWYAAAGSAKKRVVVK